MSKGEGPSAADVVNGASEAELVRIFREFGEERHRAAHRARHRRGPRRRRPFERTLRARRDDRARGAAARERNKHPATRVFQALRIHVNGELDELETALDAALARLAPRGRLAVISFHSLEDRMVKHFMRRHALADPVYAGLPYMPAHARAETPSWSGKPIEPGESQETERNPRARSARLRVAERLSEGPRRMTNAPDAVARVAACCGSRCSGPRCRSSTRAIRRATLFVRLEKLNAERDSLEMEWGRLQLEQSYWSSHAFVERVANAKLQMNLPQTRDVRIVRP